MGHELRHASADIYGTRDFGTMSPYERQPMPGSPDWYEKGQAFEEAETHSYSLRRAAEQLLASYLRPDLEHNDADDAARRFAHYAHVSVLVAERNDILINTLNRTLTGRWQWNVFLPDEDSKFPDRRYIMMPMRTDDGRAFVYELNIHDQSLTTYDEVKVYLRAKARLMTRLAANYRVQFATARAVAAKFMNLQTPREKAAVLAGLIAITRPHFWEENTFVDVTEAELIARFNVVVSDRWQRYSYLEPALP